MKRFVLSAIIISIAAFLAIISRPGPDGKPSRNAFVTIDTVLSSLNFLKQKLTPPPIQVLELSASVFKFQVIYSITKLDVPDLLAKGPLHVDAIANKLKVTNKESLRRILRAASTLGYMTQVDKDTYENNAMSDMLRSDRPDTVKYTILHFGNHLYKPWGHLVDAVNQKEPIATTYYGKDFWSWLDEHKDESEVFDRSMKSISSMSNSLVATDYNWSQFNRVADIGGGIGSLLEAILQYHPSVHGILFDRPASIEVAREAWKKSPYSNRVDLHEGDFFKSVPESDAYVLRFIIHDWNDEDSVKILKTVRDSIGSRNATLFVIDHLIGEKNWHWVSPELMDLNMLVMLDAQERTKEQMTKVFNDAGFEFVEALQTRSPFYISVGRPIQKSV